MKGGQWARADATRQALLDAAQEVFADRGYADAGIAEIVERSGSSVGSLYHHYGGKAGLYLALWEDHTGEQERSATEAVARARKARDAEAGGADTGSAEAGGTEAGSAEAGGTEAGERDPIALFIAGARAYLEVCWRQRDVARLFHETEGPSGFALMRRSRARQWVGQNTRLLRGPAGERSAQVLSLVLTTVIGEAGREIALAEDEAEATEIIDEICRILVRLAGDGRES